MDVGTPEQVDLSLEDERLAALHIGTAWKELRRGAAMSILRDHMFGAGKDAVEPGQVDTLDLLVQQPAWRMSDLADALRVDPSTATRGRCSVSSAPGSPSVSRRPTTAAYS